MITGHSHNFTTLQRSVTDIGNNCVKNALYWWEREFHIRNMGINKLTKVTVDYRKTNTSGNWLRKVDEINID